MVYLKTPEEIRKMQKAGRVVALAHEAIEALIRPGISTKSIDELAEKIIRAEGAEPSFLHYGTPPFPASVCTSVNEAVVHGIPSSEYILQEGDIVSVDIGAKLDGFHGDMARTFGVGKVDENVQKLIKVTEECFWKGFSKALVGNRIGDISLSVSEHAEAHGYGVVRELVGHGIGRNLHEEPDVPNFGKGARGMRLVPGLVIAVEPMINMGNREIETKSDRWTIVTKDRKPSAHYENTIAITEDGPLILTKVDL